MKFTRSNFGVKGCVANKNTDIPPESCYRQELKDGKVPRGGCTDLKDSSKPGYKNATRFPNCCVNDPPQECIRKPKNQQPGQQQTTQPKQRNNNDVNALYNRLSGNYAPPSSVYNAPSTADGMYIPVKPTNYQSNNLTPMYNSLSANYAPQQVSVKQQNVIKPNNTTQPVRPRRDLKKPRTWFKKTSKFGSSGYDYKNIIILLIVIGIGYYFFKNKKGSSFGKRRR